MMKLKRVYEAPSAEGNTIAFLYVRGELPRCSSTVCARVIAALG
jgi:hypothetical protein